jgi:BirA family biotin operon repressor/biotin-[acetyl-CoA-carboxylase] ligase
MQAEIDRHAAEAGLRIVPVWVGETDSTQDVVRAWAEAGRPGGLAAITDRQRGGRGRLGRTWESPPGSGVQLSILLRPRLPIRRFPLVSLATAVALVDALPTFRIKWPNDLLDPVGRKVAGVLAEAEPSGGAVIVGVGLNVRSAPDLPGAACLADTVVPPDAAALGVAVVGAVQRRVAQLATDAGGVLDAWRAADALRGRTVDVGNHSGVADGIDDDGALRLRTDGGVTRITAGEVQMVGHWTDRSG